MMRRSFGSIPANALRRAFLRRFRREVDPIVPGSADGLIDRTAAAAQRLFDDRREELPDRQAFMVVGLCSLILAAYRELVAEGIDRNAAYEAVRRAFLATYRTPMRLFTRLLLLLFRDPVPALSRMSLKRSGDRIFGSMMGFDEAVTSDRVDLIVTRCAFNRFFVENGEPLLTRILCEGDRNWMDVVDASRRPIRMERPRTISTGADRCEFHHVRTTEKTGAPRDVVLDRRSDVARALGSTGGSSS